MAVTLPLPVTEVAAILEAAEVVTAGAVAGAENIQPLPQVAVHPPPELLFVLWVPAYQFPVPATEC